MTSLVQNADENAVIVSALYAMAIDRIVAYSQSEGAEDGAALAFDVSAAELAAAISILADAPPQITIVDGAVLLGAKAAYAAEANTIYVSAEFLELNRGNDNAIISILIEELGHAIDAMVRDTDAPGDEGQIFAALVAGSSIDPHALKENDHGVVVVDGQLLAVEFAQYGAINVDGELSDWSAADRLDIGVSSVPGYAVYGKVVDGFFVIALQAPSAINTNTTFWLNTDLNASTGYLVFDFAAGAEYNVNLDAAGTPTLYTGAAGQFAVPGVVLDFVFSADRSILEFAIPISALGGAVSADMLIDHNDGAFLPSDYSLTAYRVDADTPPVVIGGVTLDGALLEWSGARIDTQGGAEGYELYGKSEGDFFVFALKAPALIGPGTTLWLNTDFDAQTGFQIFGGSGGAEYNINWAANGAPVLYTGADGETAVEGAVVQYKTSADGSIVEFAIAKSAIGATTGAHVLADVNNSVFLPGNYSGPQYLVGSLPAPPVIGTVTLDGELGDWTDATRIDAGNVVAGYEAYGKVDGDFFVLALKGPSAIGTATTVWFNTDLNAATGFQIFGSSGGAEFNINWDASGTPRLYTGDAGQTLVAGATVLHRISADGTIVEFAIARSALGSPALASVLIDINNGANLPSNFSGPQYLVTAAPPQVDDIVVDGSLADWAGAGRIDTHSGTVGFEVYGKAAGDYFVMALQAPVAIATGTTIWLNTDFDSATGVQVFPGGNSGGAEYYINWEASGRPTLYAASGAAVEGAEVHTRSSLDGTIVELAFLKSAVGGATGAHVVLDVNDTAFLPGSFQGPQYLLGALPAPAIIGAKTIDGELADWAGAGRIDGIAPVAGYEAYGTVEAGFFVLALTGPAPIGPGTTIWFNTDLNSATGFQIFGNAGGAEYNINWDSSGKPRLYTGDAGQNLVAGAEVFYRTSADGLSVEIAIAASALGAVTMSNVLIDINNGATLPGTFSGPQYTVSPPAPPPPVVGAYTLDGDLADWANSERIDTPAPVAGYEVYGKSEGDYFVFALKGPGAIGPNTTVWLNTDLNIATGTQVFGAVGGEFNINWDGASTPILYTGDAGQNLVAGAEVLHRASADGTIVEFAVLKSALGGPVSTGLVLDVNNSAFLPGSYSGPQYIIAPPPPAPVTLGSTTIDGAIGDWTANQRIDLFNGTAGHEVYGKIDGDAIIFALRAPAPIGANTTVWLNTDLNAGTGYQIFGSGGGAEFNINFDLAGVPHLYTGGAGGTLVNGATVHYARSADGLTIEFAIAKSALGNPVSTDVLLDVNDVTFLPAPYGPQYHIAPPAPQQGAITLDGALGDWTLAQNIVKPGTGAAGYEMYGTATADAYVIALQAPAAISQGTTIYLNADQNATTGYQVFGNAGGVEYAVQFNASGHPQLYAVDAGSGALTLVEANLAYGRSADGRTIELAINKAQIQVGGAAPKELNLLTQVNGGPSNGGADLPSIFATQPSYEIVDTVALNLPPRTDFSKKVAIVYSESTAKVFFGHPDEGVNVTAYGQLFMTAQSQAAAAGVPFDILTEDDLMDINILKEYDSIVFPAFRNVAADKFVQISNALELAVEQYGIGLIASGDFMTHTESGALLPGDPYARMKEFFDLGPEAFGTGIVEVRAAGQGHPVMDGYAAGELIRTYEGFHLPGDPAPGVGWAAYGDATPGAGGVATVLATQTVNGQTTAAVIATETGGRNVHFSTASYLGDNNQLQHAIEWSVNGSGVTVGLQIGRQASIVAARNDMDQAQESYDVDPDEGANGIYDVLVPILQEWKAAYNFVGSYYIDIGAYPPDQYTNWALSSGYFQQMLADGNEIGSHSFTHPSDTNLLLPDVVTQELFDQRVAAYQALLGTEQVCYCPYCTRDDADPAVIDALAQMSVAQINAKLATLLTNMDGLNFETMDPVDKAILESSYKFQFGQSRHVIEQNLGITVTGAAVPGAPEQLFASLEMIKYYDYLSGGASTFGAGYPGAFGYLTPEVQDKIYLAPNMSFDFTLIGFQGKTPAEALTIWKEEYDALTAHGDVPIVMWPWHDYGPTQWMLDEGVPSPYTKAMFTDFIAYAAGAGAEFVTLDDLAKRLAAFEKATVTYAVSGNVITATVGSSQAVADTGKFTLDLDGLGTQKIVSVAGWYAYDDDSVFLPRNGGTYEITLGEAAADVTRIITLPSRAELVSLSGDGTSLAFTLIGEGKVVIDLKNLGVPPVVTGATIVSLVGEILTLDVGAIGTHTVSLDFGAIYGTEGADTLIGTAANDVMFGLGGNDTLDGGLGADTMNGGQGDDLYLVDDPLDSVVENANEGIDTVQTALTFTLGAHVENLILTGAADVNGIGNDLNNVITGNSGANQLEGGAGNDSFDGGDGNDTILGGLGVDWLYGGAGDDVLDGGADGDALFGQDGNDTLIGGDGADSLDGGDGDDSLSGGIGVDWLYGGDGADTLDGGADTDALFGQAGDDILNGGDGDDSLDGGDGADTMNGGAGVDWLYGGADNDIMDGGADTDALFGQDGDDTLYGGDGGDNLDGGDGNDSLFGGNGNDWLYGGSGNDVMDGGADTDALFGEAGDDTLYGGDGGDNLDGGDGNDILNGGAGVDWLYGGDGDDRLDGGAGADALFGGAGADTFVFASGGGNDQIADFEDGIDMIDVTGIAGLTEFSQLIITEQDGDTYVWLPDSSYIVLSGVNPSALSAQDFLFA